MDGDGDGSAIALPGFPGLVHQPYHLWTKSREKGLEYLWRAKVRWIFYNFFFFFLLVILRPNRTVVIRSNTVNVLVFTKANKQSQKQSPSFLFVLRFYGPVKPISLPNHTFTGQA